MFQERYELQSYDAYIPYQQATSSAPTGVLERPDERFATSPVVQMPDYPPPSPRKRRGGTGTIIATTLLIALIIGTGLFVAGWSFASQNSTASTTTATASTAQAQTSVALTSGNTVQAQQIAAIAKIEPSVVELSVTTAQGQQIGSGVIIDAKGDIVTNNHVVSGAQNITVVLNTGTSVQAQLIGSSSAHDLAVVRIAPFAHMAVAQIGDSSSLAIGQEVLAIGNPLGITETATSGIVSALNRSVTEPTGAIIANAIQTDAAINPGNSGGALINLQGQLIGIPTLTAVNTQSNTPASGIGFAIPSNMVQTVVQQILQQG